MRVHIVSTAGLERGSQLERFRVLAANDVAGRHKLEEGANDADIVLFVDLHLIDPQLRMLREHPLLQEVLDRAFVYCDRDQPWCVLPGVYTSMPARYFRERWQRAWLYCDSPTEPPRNTSADPDLLYSFMGSRSHQCRDSVLGLRHPRSLIEDTSGFVFYNSDAPDFAIRKERFGEVIARSKFVLCPRGAGSCSFRLLETMAAGRVPVIISDSWVPPAVIDWECCSIRVPEKDVATIPELLEAREPDFDRLVARTIETYESYFSPEVAFHQIVEACSSIVASSSAFPPRGIRDGQWLHVMIHGLRRGRPWPPS